MTMNSFKNLPPTLRTFGPHCQRGFNLIELLAVITITAVLVTVGAPTFTATVGSAQATDAANTLVAGFNGARGQAIRLQQNVVMCRSTAPEATVPACSAAASGGYAGSDWASGWIVFADPDGNGAPDNAGAVLAIQQRFSTGNLRVVMTGSETTFTYGANGVRVGAAGTSTVGIDYATPGSSQPPVTSRCLRLTFMGMPSVDRGVCA
jgi:type IV fimbrial biogenesis protein FimT